MREAKTDQVASTDEVSACPTSPKHPHKHTRPTSFFFGARSTSQVDSVESRGTWKPRELATSVGHKIYRLVADAQPLLREASLVNIIVGMVS